MYHSLLKYKPGTEGGIFLLLLLLVLQAEAAVTIRKGTFPSMCPGGSYVTQSTAIVLKEAVSTDFGASTGGATYTYVLIAPTGFEFRSGFGNVDDYPVGTTGDFDDNVSLSVTASQVTITLVSDLTPNNSIDSIFVTNLQMRALSTASTGSITRSGGTLNTNPLNTGVSHADLMISFVPGNVTVANQSRCSAGMVTFVPSAAGASSYVLYDQDNFLLTTGTTLSDFITTSKNYYISSINATGCENPNKTPVQAIVNTAVSISVHPSNRSICTSTNASYTVTASGTNATYQWQEHNGVSWSNLTDDNSTVYQANTQTLLMTGVSTSKNNYSYRCVVTGTCGTATSNAASLFVTGNAVINAQPPVQTVCEGFVTNFSVLASGAGITYQWQEHNGLIWSNSSDDAVHNGINTNTITVVASALMHGYKYRCIVTGTCGPSVISDIGSLNIVRPCIYVNGLNSKYCLNDDSTQLIGEPFGGIFSGPGVYNAGAGVYWFNPAKAGISGVKSISYSLTHSGCPFAETKTTDLRDDCEVVPSSSLRLQESKNNKTISISSVKNVLLYPNPSRQNVKIIATEVEIQQIELLDSNGKILWQGYPEGSEISTTGLNKGIYYIQLYSSDKVWSEKLIIE